MSEQNDETADGCKMLTATSDPVVLYQALCGATDELKREREALRQENNRLIELLRRDKKTIWMDGARSGAEGGIDMAIKSLENLRESILEKLKEGGE